MAFDDHKRIRQIVICLLRFDLWAVQTITEGHDEEHRLEQIKHHFRHIWEKPPSPRVIVEWLQSPELYQSQPLPALQKYLDAMSEGQLLAAIMNQSTGAFYTRLVLNLVVEALQQNTAHRYATQHLEQAFKESQGDLITQRPATLSRYSIRLVDESIELRVRLKAVVREARVFRDTVRSAAIARDLDVSALELLKGKLEALNEYYDAACLELTGEETHEMLLDVQRTDFWNPQLTPQSNFLTRRLSDFRLVVGLGLQVLNAPFLREPPLDHGKARVRWKCSCGELLYDDFTELVEGAAQRLEASLTQKYPGSTITSNNSSRSFSNPTKIMWGLLGTMGRFIGHKAATLPLHELQTSPQNNHSSIPDHIPPERLYLLLCYHEGLHATKLLQLPLHEASTEQSPLSSDKAFFKQLSTSYSSVHNRFLYRFTFRTLISIKFVQFEMYKSRLVDIRLRNSVPLPEDKDYQYTPAPPDVMPPVGENHLMHLFRHPEHAEEDAICVLRVPKKLRRELAVETGSVTTLGWGLQLEEGWDTSKTWIVAFELFGVGSLVWGLVWVGVGGSVQDAFSVAGYVVSLAVLTIGFLQAVAGRLR